MNRNRVTVDILVNTGRQMPISIRYPFEPWKHQDVALMIKPITLFGAALVGGVLPSSAMADVAVAVRAGSFGYGADFDVGMTDTLNLRLGYNAFSYSRTINDTDVSYDKKLKIGAASAILDCDAFRGGFRLSVGAVQKGPKVDVTGKLAANGTYLIELTYNAAQIGNATGTIKIGDSVTPYIGNSWGNTVDKEDRITFLLDISAMNSGSPRVDLTFTCNTVVASSAGDPTCARFNSRIAAEKANLKKSARDNRWYPIVS
jgi:hypothetical protein